MLSYLKNRKQKLQLTVAATQQKNVTAGVPQRAIADGHQLFSFFVNIFYKYLVLLIQYTTSVVWQYIYKWTY